MAVSRSTTEAQGQGSSMSDKMKSFVSKVEKAVTPSKGSTMDQVKDASKATSSAIDKDS